MRQAVTPLELQLHAVELVKLVEHIARQSGQHGQRMAKHKEHQRTLQLLLQCSPRRSASLKHRCARTCTCTWWSPRCHFFRLLLASKRFLTSQLRRLPVTTLLLGLLLSVFLCISFLSAPLPFYRPQACFSRNSFGPCLGHCRSRLMTREVRSSKKFEDCSRWHDVDPSLAGPRPDLTPEQQ